MSFQENLSSLREMFPNHNRELISQILSEHNNNMDAAIAILLDTDETAGPSRPSQSSRPPPNNHPQPYNFQPYGQDSFQPQGYPSFQPSFQTPYQSHSGYQTPYQPQAPYQPPFQQSPSYQPQQASRPKTPKQKAGQIVIPQEFLRWPSNSNTEKVNTRTGRSSSTTSSVNPADQRAFDEELYHAQNCDPLQNRQNWNSFKQKFKNSGY